MTMSARGDSKNSPIMKKSKEYIKYLVRSFNNSNIIISDARYIEDDHDLTSAAVHATKHSGNSEETVTFSRVVCSLGKIKQSTSKDLDIDTQGLFYISLSEVGYGTVLKKEEKFK